MRELADESIFKHEVKDEHEEGNATSPPWDADDDVFFAVAAVAQDAHTTGQFQGPKANKGHVSHSTRDGKSVLTLSDDFVVPDTPDPHWQVVDSNGQVYLLDKLKKKALLGDKYQKEIVLPSYVKNVKKVVIWCAWAEANLGEASFSSPVM